jgi:hypothetical protein
VVRRVVLLLNHIHILHLNLFTPELVTTRVTERIHLIQLKLIQRRRNEMSGLTVTRKIWYFSISSFHCPLFNYYVVLIN